MKKRESVIRFRAPKEVHDALRRRAEREGTSMSAMLLRHALEMSSSELTKEERRRLLGDLEPLVKR